jgi:transcriptional regulator of acetoin/glycerol metabolism
MLLVASVLAGGGQLTLQHFPELLEWENLGHPNWEKANDADLDGEAEKIKMALSAANGNVTKAADMLGINRATLYRKMKKYNFPR